MLQILVLVNTFGFFMIQHQKQTFASSYQIDQQEQIVLREYTHAVSPVHNITMVTLLADSETKSVVNHQFTGIDLRTKQPAVDPNDMQHKLGLIDGQQPLQGMLNTTIKSMITENIKTSRPIGIIKSKPKKANKEHKKAHQQPTKAHRENRKESGHGKKHKPIKNLLGKKYKETVMLFCAQESNASRNDRSPEAPLCHCMPDELRM
jgi:hypothetical protein